MFFKCLECGHLFEPGEEARWVEPHGEPMTGCPKCRNAFAETTHCSICGTSCLEDELYHGVCKGCLIDSMSAVGMAGYLRDNSLERDFYLDTFFDEEQLMDLLRGGFLQKVALEKLSGRTDSLERCRNYISDDECGLTDYAEWYAAHRKELNNGR